jgi:phosphatidylinositol kinase/protein kinase (PI-3  family)
MFNFSLHVLVQVMKILRDNQDSVMAMLEAFVYDPLISWRLVAENKSASVVTKGMLECEDHCVCEWHYFYYELILFLLNLTFLFNFMNRR